MSRSDSAAPSAIERGAQIMTWIAGAGLIVMAFVITAETLLRKFAGMSMGGVFELTSYVFAISSTWAFGWALVQGAHIRIEVFRNNVGPKGRAAFDILAWLAFLLVFGLIAYRAADLTIQSYVAGDRASTPARTLLFIPQALWAFGLIATALSAVALGYRVVVDRSTRAIALKDEVERELEHLN